MAHGAIEGQRASSVEDSNVPSGIWRSRVLFAYFCLENLFSRLQRQYSPESPPTSMAEVGLVNVGLFFRVLSIQSLSPGDSIHPRDFQQHLKANDFQVQLSLLSFGFVSTCKSHRYLTLLMPDCELFLSSLQPAPPRVFLLVKVINNPPSCWSQKLVSHS